MHDVQYLSGDVVKTIEAAQVKSCMNQLCIYDVYVNLAYSALKRGRPDLAQDYLETAKKRIDEIIEAERPR